MGMSISKYSCPVCGRMKRCEGICTDCSLRKERIDSLEMTDEELAEKQKYISENLGELAARNDPAEKYFEKCLSGRGTVFSEVQRKAAENDVFYPAELYYHAPADVRGILISKLENEANSLKVNHILSALAMQGDDTVLEKFREWKKTPPYKAKLYVGTDHYAALGGRTFDENVNIIPTMFFECIALEPSDKPDSSVKAGRVRDDKCPHCGGDLVDILSIDGNDEKFSFIGVKGRLAAVCCPNCIVGADSAYSVYTGDGSASAVFPYDGLSEDETNYLSEDDYKKMNECSLAPLPKKVPLFYGRFDDHAATVGGFANWVDDMRLLECPCCHKPMRYLAQLPWYSVWDGGNEGTLYIEICTDCKHIGMVHQQT